jgi:hypothetical protein
MSGAGWKLGFGCQRSPRRPGKCGRSVSAIGGEALEQGGTHGHAGGADVAPRGAARAAPTDRGSRASACHGPGLATRRRDTRAVASGERITAAASG